MGRKQVTAPGREGNIPTPQQSEEEEKGGLGGGLSASFICKLPLLLSSPGGLVGSQGSEVGTRLQALAPDRCGVQPRF